ncbi:uncharacterized protein METZ01_LOCUS277694, partial [marine metagenome]
VDGPLLCHRLQGIEHLEPGPVDEMESLSEFVLLLTGGDIHEFGSQLTE